MEKAGALMNVLRVMGTARGRMHGPASVIGGRLRMEGLRHGAEGRRSSGAWESGKEESFMLTEGRGEILGRRFLWHPRVLHRLTSPAGEPWGTSGHRGLN